MVRSAGFLLCFAALAAPGAALAQDLPPGKGDDVVQRVCTTCHGLDQIMAERHDTNGWRTVVDNMMNNGAVATDDEADQIVAYLATAFPAK